MNERLLRGEMPGPGRPKGLKNKIPESIRKSLENWVEDKLGEFDAIWGDLKPKEKARFVSDVLPYVLPKLSATDNMIAFERLADSDLDLIIKRLTGEQD